MFESHSRPALKESLYAMMLPGNTLVLGGTPGEGVVMPNVSAFDYQLLLLLDGALTITEITAQLNAHKITCSEIDVIHALHALDEQRLLEDHSIASNMPEERYNRQALFFAAMQKRGMPYASHIQERLQRSHIVLFGLGGFGSHLFYEFAAMGVGKLTLVDYECVEISNLNRQILYNEADVGKSKLDAAREKSRFMNSSIEYVFIEKKISSSDDFSQTMAGADLAVLVADNPREHIFAWINHAAYQCHVPVLFSLGASQESIRIGPLVVPGKTACFNCSMPGVKLSGEDALVQFINRRHHHGIIIPHLMIASGMMGLESIKHLTGYGNCRLYNHRIFLDVNTYETRTQEISPRKNCEYCG